MISRRLRLTLGKVAGAGLVAAVAVAMAAPPAFADTSTATANAATVTLGSATLLTTGSCSSSNAGAPAATQTCGQTPGLAVLGAQTAIAAGVLAQQTVAFGNGTSAACAGLVGSGGTIQIGSSGDCTVSGANPGGVTVNLGALAVLKADAILAECTSSSTGTPTASVQLVNASVNLLAGGSTPLTSAPGPNDNIVNLGVLATATLNKQPATLPAPPIGSISTTALNLTVLGLVAGAPPLVHLTVGTVSCGPDVATVPTPAFPLKGAPIALGILALAGFIGWRFWWVPRQRADSAAL
jgi:hypothetical protein